MLSDRLCRAKLYTTEFDQATERQYRATGALRHAAICYVSHVALMVRSDVRDSILLACSSIWCSRRSCDDLDMLHVGCFEIQTYQRKFVNSQSRPKRQPDCRANMWCHIHVGSFCHMSSRKANVAELTFLCPQQTRGQSVGTPLPV